MDNKIQVLPQAFYQYGCNLSKSLVWLVLSNNPLFELKDQIKIYQKLRVIGLSQTKITSLPAKICAIPNLQEIYVENCDLAVPPLAVAKRGMTAINDFFNQTAGDLGDDAKPAETPSAAVNEATKIDTGGAAADQQRLKD